MRAVRELCGQFEAKRCKSKNRGARCEFCPGYRGSLILDCDLIKAAWRLGGPTSDCIVIACHGSHHVAVVEIKGRRYSPPRALSQLAAGAGLAMDILGRTGLLARSKIHLVLVAPGHTYDQVRALTSHRLRVRGRMFRVHAVRCGTQLPQVISRAQRRR